VHEFAKPPVLAGFCLVPVLDRVVPAIVWKVGNELREFRRVVGVERCQADGTSDREECASEVEQSALCARPSLPSRRVGHCRAKGFLDLSHRTRERVAGSDLDKEIEAAVTCEHVFECLVKEDR
jgi:hypothetical protein